MSHLGEDAEAFFRTGDEGTYDGGPRSLSPSTRDSVQEEDDLATEVPPEILERRDRMQRIVKRVIGTLGAAVLVLLPFRLGIAGGSSTATAATAVEVATPSVAVAPKPVDAPRAEVTPSPEPQPVVPSTSTASGTREPAPAVVAAPARKPSVVASAAAHVPAKVTSSHGAARAVTPASTARHSSVSTLNAAPRALGTRRGGGHVPPTASFPD